MGHKAVETTRNTNNASGRGTANKCAVQWWFKFCKGDKSLEDVEFSGLSSEVDDGQLRQSSKLILLQLHETLPKNSTLTILRSLGIWSKLERWKNLISECLICWLKIKHFKVSLFLIVRNNKAPFLDWTVMCDEKWILHDNQWQPAQWLDWKEAPRHFPKANFTKKWSWSLVGGCLSDPLQLFESQWNHYIWEVCSAPRWASLQPALTAASTGQQ